MITQRDRIPDAGDEAAGLSLLTLANVLLRWRRAIIGLAFVGAVLGLVAGLTTTRVYRASAMFIPQGSEGTSSSLALAASQFGLRLPSGGGGSWGPPIYVELLRSRALLEPIARETVTVAEERNRRVPVAELFNIRESSPASQAERSVTVLRGVVSAGEVKTLGAVRVAVTTKWPSVSLQLTERLVVGVTQFNQQTRKSQASAERQFVEAQAAEAERALRAEEDRLQAFLQRNRDVSGSPQLAFERDRLQREVLLRQQVYTSLLQNREEARIREVRDLPVTTMIEEPQLPVVGEPRRTVMRIIFGGLAGALIAIVAAFVTFGLSLARKQPGEDVREFFALIESATPRFLRRRRRA